MAYKIIDIEGVGEAYAAKLEAVGINTPEALLEACASAKGRNIPKNFSIIPRRVGELP